jgi:hypothetical protein
MGLRVRCVTKIGCQSGKTEAEDAVEEGLGDGYGFVRRLLWKVSWKYRESVVVVGLEGK